MRKEKIQNIIDEIIAEAQEFRYLKKELIAYKKKHQEPAKNLHIIGIGKAAWLMAKIASDIFSGNFQSGFVITKYKHKLADIPNFEIWEAGHPIVDENSLAATKRLIEFYGNLTGNDRIIVLLSGGGSALCEKPKTGISLEKLQEINSQLINSGADIKEINAIRKYLSDVKGGKIAKTLFPTKIDCFILSDVVGNDLSAIASGLFNSHYDSPQEITRIIQTRKLDLPKIPFDQCVVTNVKSKIIGDVSLLCQIAKEIFREHNLSVKIVRDNVTENLHNFRNEIVQKIIQRKRGVYIWGGEVVLEVSGNGLGGRNMHLTLSLYDVVKKYTDITFFALGSDGTDGPTDFAGALINSETKFTEKTYNRFLADFDSYHAFYAIDNLLRVAPIGINMNDLYVLIIE